MKVAILVPRRDGFADRDRLWMFTKPWWREQFPDWPMYEGHHDIGLFNRSAAVNVASTLAGEWDVAVLIDSDVLIDPDAVRRAIPIAVEQGQMVVPFEVRHNLSQRGTERVIEGDTGSWRGYIARSFHGQHSSVVVIPRPLYDDIGGFDEGFQGWGMEDSAFAIACEVIAGKPLIHFEKGEAWHLFHMSAPGEKHGSPSHRRNMARLALYRDAHKRQDRERIQMLVADGRQPGAQVEDGIPRILHRVVPEQTPAVAEEWWKAWQRLHPTWRFLTHRDPLDPADWPLTSKHWRHVKVGAQLADLVRLEALYRWGGFYVDMDMQPFRSLEPLLGCHVVAAWEDERVVPNAFLGARPGHEAIRACIDAATREMRKSVWAGGPGVTTKHLVGRPDTLLLPPGSVYDVDYRDADRDAKMQTAPAPWTFMRHHYWGSWLPEERRRTPAA